MVREFLKAEVSTLAALLEKKELASVCFRLLANFKDPLTN